jgi:hypothetical protein
MKKQLGFRRSIIVMPKNLDHWQVLEDTIVKPFRTVGVGAREATHDDRVLIAVAASPT